MNIQIIGGGSWGLALANLLAGAGRRVRLWCREADQPETLRATRYSPYYLPDVPLHESIEVASDVDPEADMAVYAVPSHAMRGAVRQLPFSGGAIRVSVAKGIENKSLLRMSEVIEEEAGECPIAALSGPSHAEEVAAGCPASVVVASTDHAVAAKVQQAFVTPRFRVYTTTDLPGVELGGSLKNVIAIAAGACDGFGLGDSAKAALITRGLAEMARLGDAMGANPLTFSGLSGMGDLIVTCTSGFSRNRALGERVAAGENPETIQRESHMVAEGVRTTKSAHNLAIKHNVDMPVTEQVYRVLFEGANPHDAVEELMLREAKPERG